ncbi:MAG TPA: hypothetical protein VF505_07685 [Thermoanaerobaculia bacterium]
MRRPLLLLAILLIAAPVFASDCDDLMQLGALYELRSLMMQRSTSSGEVQRVIDHRIDQLREPLADGGFKWVRWVRPSDDGPTDKHVHTVGAVHGNGDPDSFEATGEHSYAVRIVVPSKRTLFKGNNRVYVGDVQMTYDARSGRRQTETRHINRWMNPDTSETFDLTGIYDHVRVTTQVSVEERDRREAVAEIHFKQAVAQDDPANPAYPTIRALNRIRDNAAPSTVDYEIGELEHSLFPRSEPMPLLAIVQDLRRADELMRSDKAGDQEKGNKLLKETLRRLR